MTDHQLRLGWPSALRIAGAAGLATIAAVASNGWQLHGALSPLWLVATFLLLACCIALIVDECVLRVQRAIVSAQARLCSGQPER